MGGSRRNTNIPAPSSISSTNRKRKPDDIKDAQPDAKKTRALVELDWSSAGKQERAEAGYASRRLAHHPLRKIDGAFTCPCCQKKFSTAKQVCIVAASSHHRLLINAQVVQHLVTVAKNSMLCPLCPSEKAKELKSWGKHIAGHTDDREACGMNGCLVTPTSKASLKSHRATHSQTKAPKVTAKFSCDVCEAVLGNEETLRVHKKLHENSLHECNHCHQMIPHADPKGHKQTYCPALPDRTAVCPVCDHKTTTTHIRRHMRVEHQCEDEVMAFSRSNFPVYVPGYEAALEQIQRDE
jgi:hypothetical protein